MSWKAILKLSPHGNLRPFRESGNEGNLTAEFSARLDWLPTTNREMYGELEEGGDFSQGSYKREKVLEFDRLTNTEKKHILDSDAMFDQFMLDFDPSDPNPLNRKPFSRLDQEENFKQNSRASSIPFPTQDEMANRNRRDSMVRQEKRTPYL